MHGNIAANLLFKKRSFLKAYHKCVECVEYLKNVLNCMKWMLNLMLNRYIFDFVLTDDNECGQILADRSTECGGETPNPVLALAPRFYFI
jgi:hypothetical protein